MDSTTPPQEAARNSNLALFDAVDHVRERQAWREIRQKARSSARHVRYIDQHARMLDAIAARDAVGRAMPCATI